MDDLAAQVLQFGIFGALAYIAKTGVTTLKELTVNVNELNQKMAVMLERMTSHAKTLEEHAERLQDLEERRRST